MRKKNRRWTKVFVYFILLCSTVSGVIYTTVTLRYDQPITYQLSGQYHLFSEQQIQTEIEQMTEDQGYLMLDTAQIERHLSDTQFFKQVRVQKGAYRVVDVFVEEKPFVMKQISQSGTSLFSATGEIITTTRPTNLPVIDMRVKKEDAEVVAEALGNQSELLLQQISEISYAFIGEARTEMKLLTIQGDLIYVKLDEMKKKLPNFLEIDTIMNQKNIIRCEYHFEYNNGNVVVKEMK